MGMQSSFCSHSTCTLKIETRHLRAMYKWAWLLSNAQILQYTYNINPTHHTHHHHCKLMPSNINQASKFFCFNRHPTSNEQEKYRWSPENGDINGATPVIWIEIEIEKPSKPLDSALHVDGGGSSVPELLALSSQRRQCRGVSVRRNGFNPCEGGIQRYAASCMYDDGKAVAVSCAGAMLEFTAPPPQMVVSEGEAWGLLSMAGGFPVNEFYIIWQKIVSTTVTRGHKNRERQI